MYSSTKKLIQQVNQLQRAVTPADRIAYSLVQDRNDTEKNTTEF